MVNGMVNYHGTRQKVETERDFRNGTHRIKYDIMTLIQKTNDFTWRAEKGINDAQRG